MATSLIRLSVESNQYEQKMRGAKKQFEDFTASIGINMKKLTAFGIATGVAATAINSLTSKISEAITEGGRMAKEYEGVKQAFDRLNQPGLLDNLKQATHGTVTELELMKQAVKFDNFGLDTNQLGSMLAFAQQQAKDTGQSVDYLVDSIVTGLGRKSLPILDNLGLSATEIRNRMGETGDMTKAVADIIQERMEKAGGYVETASDRAAQANVRLEEEMRKLGETFGPLQATGATMWQTLETGAISLLNKGLKPLIQAFTTLGQVQKIQQGMNGGGMMGRLGDNLRNSKNPSNLYARQLAAIDDAISRAEINLRRAEQGGMGSIQIYRNRVEALKNTRKEYEALYQTITQAPKASTPEITIAKPKPGGNKTKSPDFLGSLNNAMLHATAGAGGMKASDGGPSEIWKAITQGAAEATSSVDTLTEAFKALNKEQGVTGEMTKDGKEANKSWMNAATAVQQVGAAMAGIDDPAAKIIGTIGQAIATIALGYAEATTQAAKLGPWAWIAFAATGLATMISTISTIHSATGYAEGGIVRGNTYSGDQIYGGAAMVNAGELVLNRAQQSTLAAQLGSGGDGKPMRPYVSGEQIFLGLNSYLKRSGRGEIMTSKR